MGDWTRTGDRDMTVNDPDGWMTEPPIRQPPGNIWGGGNPGFHWIGSDSVDGLLRPFGLEGLDTIHRATSLVINPLVTMPWRLWRSRGGVREELPLPLWVRDPMLLGGAPGPEVQRLWPLHLTLPAADFWASWLRDALWWGDGWIAYVEDAAGLPLPGSMYNIGHLNVSEYDGALHVMPLDGYTSIPVDEDGYFTEPGWGVRYRLLRLRGPGVLKNLAASLGYALSVRTYMAGTFRSGVPAGYLTYTGPDISEEQAELLRARWMQRHGGSTRSVAVLNATTTFTPVQLSPVDANAVGVWQSSLTAVAHAFNIDALMLNAETTSNTYSNRQDVKQDHVDHTLAMPAMQAMSVLSSLLPYGSELAVDWRGYLLTNVADRVAYYTAGLQGGWLTADEVRGLERLPRSMVQE